MTLRALLTLVAVGFLTTGYAADFHIDPVHGDDGNEGSRDAPWASLQHVVDTGLIESRDWDALPYNEDSHLAPKDPGAPVKAGDTIWLHEGNHGALDIAGYYNESRITVAVADGEVARFHQMMVRGCSEWTFKGLTVSPLFGAGPRPQNLIMVESSGWLGPVSNVRVEGCTVFSAEDTAAWSAADWVANASDGIFLRGDHLEAVDNTFRNIHHGIQTLGTSIRVAHNLVENFSGDGIRGISDHSVYEYNTVKNCYDVDDNHDDGFQSWSYSSEGSGTSEIVDVVLRGNTIINYEDPDQPLRGPLQGIGCFDGFYVDWVVENNVVIVDHWHGITLMGARNCRIINNTVVQQNFHDPNSGPWILIDKHKDGRESTVCVIRNNVARQSRTAGQSGVLEDHNVVSDDYGVLFVDAAARDYHLAGGSPAIDAGTPDLAPSMDRDGVARPQGTAFDAGAYERPVGNGSVGALSALLQDFSERDTDHDRRLSLPEIRAGSPSFSVSVFDAVNAEPDVGLTVAELLEANGPGILHRADTTGDHVVSVPELLRLVQFYGASGYGCAENAGASEDGYAPVQYASANAECMAHDADTDDDRTISLPELLRVVQLWNGRGYTYCPNATTPDGFCLP